MASIREERIIAAVNELWRETSGCLQTDERKQMTELEWVIVLHSLLTAIKTGVSPEKQDLGL